MGNLNENALKQLTRRLQELECEAIRKISEEPEYLSHHEATNLRWAMSLARITKVKAEAPDVDVNIDHASDRYRALLFALCSQALNSSGRLTIEKIKEIALRAGQLAESHRADLLKLFKRMPKEALDNATRSRPLALVLSGGGGTAYVFIGAFLALEESNLIPSVIAGSSMGAILGAYRARTKHFSFSGLDNLVEKTSWRNIVQPYSGKSRFGVPGTFRLYLRDVVGHEFQKDGAFMTLADLAIPLRVCVAGLSAGHQTNQEELERYAHALNGATLQGLKKDSIDQKSILSIIMDFAQQPLKAIYLGSDDLTKDFDVLDAIGFSAAIPGIFHYDILRDDPRMVKLVSTLLEREGVVRLIDGGFVDNLPAKEAIRAVQSGISHGYDPFVLALDSFAPGLNRHLLFYAVMRFALENSREGHELSHLSIYFKNVLSPLHLVPTPQTFDFAVKQGHSELMRHISFIRKMVGPIPEPSWLKNDKI